MPRTYCSYSLPVLASTQYRLRIDVRQVFRVPSHFIQSILPVFRIIDIIFAYPLCAALDCLFYTRPALLIRIFCTGVNRRFVHRTDTEQVIHRCTVIFQHRLQDQTNRYLFQGMNELQDILHLHCYHQPLS